jgi:hypothetical protein
MAFSSQGGFSLDRDHLDMSFAKREGWTTLDIYGVYSTPHSIFLGDPNTGPALSLSQHEGVPDASYRTPTHYHGTDEFRIVLKGRVKRAVNQHTLEGRQFIFQDAGMGYVEGFSGSEEVWVALILGDRRGVATAALPSDIPQPEIENLPEEQENLPEEQKAAAAAFAALVELAKQNPGGPKGIPSVSTTVGSCRHGFLVGSFDAEDGWRELGEGVQVAAGMWGDRASGPIMLMIKGGPGAMVIPGFTSATETMCVLAAGSCRIGDAKYEFGDLRIQAADAHQDALTAGPEGVELMLMIADRRALPKVSAADARWRAGLDTIVADLEALLAARPLNR